MRATIFIVLACLLTFSSISRADVSIVKWEKSATDRYTVAAIDLATRNLLWEVAPCKKDVNFAERTSAGVLVACEKTGDVILLDLNTGKELWRRNLTGPGEALRGKTLEVDRFRGEKSEGFFVSVSDETYLLIGKDGQYLMRCDIRCESNPPVEKKVEAK